MSTKATLLTGRDTYVDQSTPNRNYGAVPVLRIANTASNIRYAFLWFARPLPIGATPISAILSLRLKGAGWAGGPHTITARRITAIWTEEGVTYNTIPATSGTHTATLAITGGVDGQLAQIDLTAMMADVAAAGLWYGVRLEVNTTGSKGLYASEAATRLWRPKLDITYNLAPDAPDRLYPDTGVGISPTKPTFKWEFSTQTDDEDQAYSQLQISTDPAFGTTFYDSGMVANTDQHWDTSLTAMAALADNTVYYWRVMVRDSQSVSSPWSDVATFTRRSAGVLTITVPAADGTSIVDNTPTITHTFTGRTQAFARYVVYNLEADGSWTQLFIRPRMADTALTYTIPAGVILQISETYKVRVDVWDDQTRPEDEYVRQERTFIWDGNAAVTAPASLVGTVIDPKIRLTWTRASAPDAWGIWVDDVQVTDDIPGAELSTGGTNYQYDCYAAKPGVSHTIKVRAKTNGTGYSASVSVVVTNYSPVGIWLVETDVPVEVQILGKEEIDTDLAEDLAVVGVLNSREPIVLYGEVRGYEGEASGLLSGDAVVSSATWRSRMELLRTKYRTSSNMRLIWGRKNLPVRIGQAQISEWPDTTETYRVSFPFWQRAEFLPE